MWLFLLSLSPLCMIWAFCAVLQALPAARLSVLLVALPRLFPDHLQPVSLPDALATEQQRWGGGRLGTTGLLAGLLKAQCLLSCPARAGSGIPGTAVARCLAVGKRK